MNNQILLKEGTWKAYGNYYDEKLNNIDLVLDLEIVKEGECYRLSKISTLLLENSVEIYSDFIIEPLLDKDFTQIEEDNELLGKLKGKLTIINDSFILNYSSEYENYSGTEVYNFKDNLLYSVKGLLYKDDIKVSSWFVKIK
ncbi:MAG: hypothetical protein N4A54_04890 [Peptostreptococcaceae bacterium]|nr:hypothetical protein [Peptostreptococcaceae bacterium]